MGGKISWVWALRAAIAVVALGSLISTVSFGTGGGGPAPDREQVPRPEPSATPPPLGPEVIVPDLVGRETDRARATLLGLDLFPDLGRIDRTDDGLWSMVRGQQPDPGERIPTGSGVFLVVTSPDRPELQLEQRSGCDDELQRVDILHNAYLTEHIAMRAPRGRLRLRDGRANEDGTSIDLLWRQRGGYNGPYLIRAARTDGPGTLEFGQEPDITPNGPTLYGTPDELHFARGGATDDYAWLSTMQVDGTGCFSFQIDGIGFTEFLDIEVTL